MHPRTAELAELLDQARAELREAVNAVPLDATQRPPAPGLWSPAEIVDHLRLVETGLVRLLGRLLDQAGPLPPLAESGSVRSCLDGLGVLDRRQRTAAPERLQPSATANLSAALAELEQARRGLHALLARTDGRATDRIVVSHPHLGPLCFDQWVVFLAQHEARHTAQLRDAAAGVG